MFPSLDFSCFHDPSQREEFCRQFVSTLKEYGFVKLINHGIPFAQIDLAFAAVCFRPPVLRCVYPYLIIGTPLLPITPGTKVEITSSTHRASPSRLQSGRAGEHWSCLRLWQRNRISVPQRHEGNYVLPRRNILFSPLVRNLTTLDPSMIHSTRTSGPLREWTMPSNPPSFHSSKPVIAPN